MSSSDSDEENAIRYGTPLEPYEEDEIPSKRKYQQPADQYAVDAHGRRRFHGAFTGGFSAGFGNTVGSQEGWTPSTFKSSRSEKAQNSSQKPEDFMDEEDRSEFGIAPKFMQTHSEFSGHKRQRQTFHDGPIPGEPVLGQLLRAVHETAAVRMLRNMGWRPGQGTGDRVTKKEKKKARDQQKVYGCFIPEEMRQDSQTQESDDSSDSEFEYDTLFAPDDYEPYVLHRKSDRFGLGYQALSRHSVLGNMAGEYGEVRPTSHLRVTDKGKKVSIRGQAFGVGAFEADDEDIYAKEDMSHYDFAIGGPPPDTGKRKPKEKGGRVLEGFVRATKPLPAVASYPPPALPRDYTPAAAGARRTRFEPTDAAPRDQGLGRHELTAQDRGAMLGETPPKPPQMPAEKQTNTKEDLIAKILGRNVNFVSTTESAQLKNVEKTETSTLHISTSSNNVEASSNNSLTSTNNSVTSPNLVTTLQSKLPEKIIDLTKPTSSTPDYISIKDSGKELVKVFKPFAGNPAKQFRYEKYLNDKNSVLERDGEMDRLNEWERERELVEFEQAAKLYRPLTGVMGDRFTHATEPDDSTNPLKAVTKSKSNYGLATEEQVAAAEKGVYGVMTRTRVPWRPENVVCKRFNVPQPGVDRPDPKKEDKPKVSYSIFSYLESSVHDKDSFAKEQSKFSGSKSIRDIPKTNPDSQNTAIDQSVKTDSLNDRNVKEAEASVTKTDNVTSGEDKNEGSFKRMTTAELFLKESEKSKEKGQEVTDTIEKFDRMDLYKSIFLSDSEEEEDLTNKNSTFTVIDDDFMETPKNLQRNTSPPRGIFANIDFDELNSWRRVEKPDSSQLKSDTDKKSDTKEAEQKDSSMEVEEVYGPKIPDNIQKRLQSIQAHSDGGNTAKNKPNKSKDVVEIDSSSSDSWVDAKEVKKKKSKHKKKKSKHKKSKHKKKDR